jgi:hypothetical protein
VGQERTSPMTQLHDPTGALRLPVFGMRRTFLASAVSTT